MLCQRFKSPQAKSVAKPIHTTIIACFKLCLHKSTGGIIAASASESLRIAFAPTVVLSVHPT